MTYHVSDAELRAWAQDRIGETAAWSVEAHLDGEADRVEWRPRR